MTVLSEKLINIFANISATGPSGEYQLTQFGSKKAGYPVATVDPDIIQSLQAYDYGMGYALLNSAPPPMQDIDALNYLITRQLSYIQQTGIPEYDASTEYFIGSIVNDAYGTLMISIANNNIGHATTDTAWWKVCRTNVWTTFTSGPQTLSYTQINIIENSASPITVNIPEEFQSHDGLMIKFISLQSGINIVPVSGTIKGLTGAALSANQKTIIRSNGTNDFDALTKIV